MLIEIKGVLDRQQLEAATALIRTGIFSDGTGSAGMAAQRVKHNEEVALDTARMSKLNNLVMGNLVKHPVYRSAAMSLKFGTPY